MTSLRDHPLMTYHHIGNWPPVWAVPTKGRRENLKGEIGTLRHVHSATGDFPSNKCFLVIEYEGQLYCGALLFDDITFCSQISAILHTQLGHSIKEIGDLDLSHTF
jgi:hypothetical protein